MRRIDSALTPPPGVHLQYRHSGAWADVSLPPLVSLATFDLAVSALQTALQLADSDLTAVRSGDGVLIVHSGAAAFELLWLDTEVSEYYGATAATTYYCAGAWSSTTAPSGTWSATDLGGGVRYLDRLERRYSTRPDGTVGACLLARRLILDVQIATNATGVTGLAKVLSRLQAGETGALWLDTATPGAAAWTAADWLGYRKIALWDPSKELDFTQYLRDPYASVRQLTVRFVEVA